MVYKQGKQRVLHIFQGETHAMLCSKTVQIFTCNKSIKFESPTRELNPQCILFRLKNQNLLTCKIFHYTIWF